MFQSLFPSNRTFFISQPSWTYIYLCYLFICCPSSVVSIIKLLNCMVNQHLCLFILLSGNATATWQCCHLSGKAAIYLAMLLPIRQCCHLSGNAAAYLAMLPPICQCCCLSGNTATYFIRAGHQQQ